MTKPPNDLAVHTNWNYLVCKRFSRNQAAPKWTHHQKATKGAKPDCNKKQPMYLLQKVENEHTPNYRLIIHARVIPENWNYSWEDSSLNIDKSVHSPEKCWENMWFFCWIGQNLKKKTFKLRHPSFKFSCRHPDPRPKAENRGVSVLLKLETAYRFSFMNNQKFCM